MLYLDRLLCAQKNPFALMMFIMSLETVFIFLFHDILSPLFVDSMVDHAPPMGVFQDANL